MLQVLQNKSLSLLETLVTTLDQYEPLQKRPKYLAKKGQALESQDEDAADQKARVRDDDALARSDYHHDDVAPKDKFKELSLELLDIGLFTGHKGFKKI